MATAPTDKRIEQALIQSRMVSSEQIQSAKAEQVRLSQSGRHLPLADVLVELNVITDAIRENVIEAAKNVDPSNPEQIGRFKIVKMLGEGGMGAVYLAKDTENNNHEVALKVLPMKFAKQPENLSRFKREARAATQLRHKNIAAALAEGEENGVHYYAMEYCEGESLDELRNQKTSIPIEQSLDIIIQVATGLQFAHGKGFVHRDIKPANIFIADSGDVKILDMGLTKDLGADELSFNTQSGAVLGTAHYISPEQARGDKEIDGRADIYSLGATFYNLVTGTTPFHGATPALVMMKHLTEHLPNPQDLVENVPDGVVQVIRKMMAKDPGDRYRGCGDLLKDLESVKAGHEPEFAGLDDEKSNVLARKGKDAFNEMVARAKFAMQDEKALKKPKSKAAFGLMIAGAVAVVAVIGFMGWKLLDKRTDERVEKREQTKGADSQVPDDPSIEMRKAHLIYEDFAHVDLDKVRDSWNIVDRPAFSIVAATLPRSSLRIKTGSKDVPFPQLDIPLDAQKVRGQAVIGTINAQTTLDPAEGAPAKGAGAVGLFWIDSGGMIFRERVVIDAPEKEWGRYQFKHKIPSDAKGAFIRIESTAAGNIGFAELIVDIEK